MCWYRSLFRNDIPILLPQLMPHIGVNLQIQRLNLLPQALHLLFEIRSIITVQPVIGCISEVIQASSFVAQFHVFFEHLLHLWTNSFPPFHPDVF